ncbi:MAG TPA: hypothetical protein VND65_19630 [Candidatus Binatia bacterium]|nr:hypothetical protein [Candidatus Binatia bacterium]
MTPNCPYCSKPMDKTVEHPLYLVWTCEPCSVYLNKGRTSPDDKAIASAAAKV